MRLGIKFCSAPLGLVAACCFLYNEAKAQSSFPTRPITIVVPFPAGGTADLLPRLVAEKIKTRLNQTVIIDNKPGASGNIGSEFVWRASPDGYTLLNAPQLTFSVNHLLNPGLRFDPRTFSPIGVIATYPTVLFARRDFPANTLPELIAYAQANPGKITYGSQGRGQIGHLTLEAISQAENISLVHVPYRGSAPAMSDLLGGQIDLLADNMLAGRQYVINGDLKLLATGGKERLKGFPDVKTLSETIPGLVSDTWMAIAAPPDTPDAIVRRLSVAMLEALREPDLVKRIEELQADPADGAPEQMRALTKESLERWAPVIAKGGIVAD